MKQTYMSVNLLGLFLVYGIKHIFPSYNNHDEKLRKIGRLLVEMANQGLLRKSESGKQWFITEKGEEDFK